MTTRSGSEAVVTCESMAAMAPPQKTTATTTAIRRVSARIGAVSPSATLAVDAKARALRAAGEDVISFGAGEPDFPTPAHIVEAAIEACRLPAYHHYTATPGLPALREAIATKTRRDSGYEVSPSQVVVTNGAKQAVYETFATLVDPGDEVLVPAPFWTTYPEAVALAGGVPVAVPTDESNGFHLTVDALRGGAVACDQGPAVRVPQQPHRGGLHPGGDGRDRALGAVARALGGHRRDL